jgi:CubicO group peptidase (beta-lactamase class C family)
MLVNVSLSGNQARFVWSTGTPAEQGFSSNRLEAMKDSLAARNTKTLLVVRNDQIVYEWYATDFNREKRHYTASLAKSLVGGMSFLVAMNDGIVFIDAPVCRYIPEWKTDPRKALITLRHLATHTSGLEDAQPKNQGGWKQGFWDRMDNDFTLDAFHLAKSEAPVLFTPGTDYHYSNPGMAMLSYAITASNNDGQHRDIRSFLKERVYDVIGLEPKDWSIGYGMTSSIDGYALVANWGGGSFTARATARVGRLMLRQGNWQGNQLIDSSLVRQAVSYAGLPLPDRNTAPASPGSGLCWYSNFDAVWKRLPRDAFAGSGAQNQTLLVIPSLEMIVVRNGGALTPDEGSDNHWVNIERYLFNPLMETFIEPPYPPSELIKSVEFAPVTEIKRKAKGSDNWPLTWADDDHMYTAYGDGWGFVPKIDFKLSLGLARIEGDPEKCKGINIRSETGERVGQGKNGPKASGLLMVDGVLYMFSRNVLFGHSRLAWSEDHGKTWQEADWQFQESFGAPTFLNFGKNYEYARDGYIYSHESPSAYVPADGMVLVRVPKESVKDRYAYEFFIGLDQNNTPRWSPLIGKRQFVFSHPAGCYRSGITYNKGLKRYLWVQILPYSPHPQGMRFQGGFGIYEAPEPWGPWKTVFFTKEWDTEPGETASLPTKWMSADGTICYMVFSGDDCFSVRKVIFKMQGTEKICDDDSKYFSNRQFLKKGVDYAQ